MGHSLFAQFCGVPVCVCVLMIVEREVEKRKAKVAGTDSIWGHTNE